MKKKVPKKKIPRRLKRFERRNMTEEEVKDKSTSIALKEVDSFRAKHERYPAPAELEKISENVFTQLKKEMKRKKAEEKSSQEIEFGEEETPKEKGSSLLEKRKARRGRRTKREEKIEEEEETEKEIIEGQKPIGEKFGDVKMPEMMEDPSEIPSQEESIKQLVGIDELSNLEESLDTSDDFDLVEKETQTPLNVCTRCNNKTKEMIYCPNCGQAFCDHCAKAVEVLEETAKYTCPNCSHEFKKRKTTVK